MITLPDGTTSDEQVVTRFLNSMFSWQVVTDGPDATCPECGYPERHRIYNVKTDTETLTADGCPSCETSRMPAADSETIMRTAIESLQAEILEARDVLARKAEERLEASRSARDARVELIRANAEEQEASRVVEKYVNALDMFGVAADDGNERQP